MSRLLPRRNMRFGRAPEFRSPPLPRCPACSRAGSPLRRRVAGISVRFDPCAPISDDRPLPHPARAFPRSAHALIAFASPSAAPRARPDRARGRGRFPESPGRWRSDGRSHERPSETGVAQPPAPSLAPLSRRHIFPLLRTPARSAPPRIVAVQYSAIAAFGNTAVPTSRSGGPQGHHDGPNAGRRRLWGPRGRLLANASGGPGFAGMVGGCRRVSAPRPRDRPPGRASVARSRKEQKRARRRRRAPDRGSRVRDQAPARALPSIAGTRIAPLEISIRRGFSASGTSRTRSM